MGTAIDAELEERIRAAVRSGMPHRTAARVFGVARATVQRVAIGRPRRQERPAPAPPFRVPWFECPQCRGWTNLKWDLAAEVCFACSVRARQSRVQS